MNMTHATGTGDSHQASGFGRAGSRRHAAFWVAGATLTLFLCGASAPSPLYAIYQAKLGFSATVLTAIFAVYAVAVLVTVLPAGELSDQGGVAFSRCGRVRALQRGGSSRTPSGPRPQLGGESPPDAQART
jgi:hypothetical protein